MTQGDADTWDPDIHGPAGEGDDPSDSHAHNIGQADQSPIGTEPRDPDAPIAPQASDNAVHAPSSEGASNSGADIAPGPPAQGGTIPMGPVSGPSGPSAPSAPSGYSAPSGNVAPAGYWAPALGTMPPQQFATPPQQQPQRQQFQGGQPYGQAPRPAHVQHAPVNQPQRQQTQGSAPAESLEHYRDRSVLPWWAWSAIGASVLSCAILVWVAASPSSLDSSSEGFNPQLHDTYRDMDLLTSSETYHGEVDDVPWDLNLQDIVWDADDQVAAQTSMTRPAEGMRYLGVRLEVTTNYMNYTPVDEAFLFYYISPGGQEFSEHYCGTGCLSDESATAYVYDGWVYFEIPETVPDGGYLRVNLLFSGDTDTLMELA